MRSSGAARVSIFCRPAGFSGGRHVHVAEIGEHERARDGRRRHDQNVGRLALLAEREALVDAETVLLVDDGEGETWEGDALLRPARACRRRCRSRPSASASSVCAPLAALSRPVSSAVPHPRDVAQGVRSLEMLAREDFRRRHIAACRPASTAVAMASSATNGLAGADVALQQAQHLLVRGHVAADVGQRRTLGVGQRIGQRRLDRTRNATVAGGAGRPRTRRIFARTSRSASCCDSNSS